MKVLVPYRQRSQFVMNSIHVITDISERSLCLYDIPDPYLVIIQDGGPVILTDFHDCIRYFQTTADMMGHVVALLVEALCYKPEGRRFDSR
jgi:hypothetical protein